MKKLISSGVVSLLVAGGLVLAQAGGASAHTPAASATCDELTVSAHYYETRPAEGEPTLIVDNPDYLPAVPGSPAVGDPTIWVPNPDYVAEVPANPGTTEYLYRQLVTGKEKWLDSITWNPGLGWYLVPGVTRVVGATPAIPAVGEPTVEVPNPAHVPAVPEVPAVGEPTLEVPNPEYVEGDETPNRAVVTVDGVVLADVEFGTTYDATFPLQPYAAHDWSVAITAWNDPAGYKGWTETFSGTTTPCEVPVVPANPGASLAAVCGAATVTLTNVQGENEANLTAAFVIEVDGEFSDAYTVLGGESFDVELTFAEDTGTHLIEVFQAGTSEWALLASGEVPSDCTEPEPTPEPTPEPEPTEKPTPTVTATPAPVVADADRLAATGAPDLVWVVVAAGGIITLGLLLWAIQAGGARAARREE